MRPDIWGDGGGRCGGMVKGVVELGLGSQKAIENMPLPKYNGWKARNEIVLFFGIITGGLWMKRERSELGLLKRLVLVIKLYFFQWYLKFSFLVKDWNMDYLPFLIALKALFYLTIVLSKTAFLYGHNTPIGLDIKENLCTTERVLFLKFIFYINFLKLPHSQFRFLSPERYLPMSMPEGYKTVQTTPNIVHHIYPNIIIKMGWQIGCIFLLAFFLIFLFYVPYLCSPIKSTYPFPFPPQKWMWALSVPPKLSDRHWASKIPPFYI